MVTLTYTTTPDEQAALDFIVAQRNAERAEQNDENGDPLPPLTASDYLAVVLRPVLASYISQMQEAEGKEIAEAFRALDPQAKADIKERMGVAPKGIE